MRRCLGLILPALLLLSIIPPSGASSISSPAYVVPAFPVMFHLRLTSNGSTAFAFIEADAYGNYVEYMCPIDYPDSDFECHEVSKSNYLLVELGNSAELIDVSGLVLRPQEGSREPIVLYTSFAPFGGGWFLVHNRTVREYYPIQNRFGSPVNVSTIMAWTLTNLWRVMSVPPEISNGSLVFTFPYNGTYRVSLGLFRPYLEPFAFNASRSMSEREFITHLRAVPFRGGLLIYLPTYGVSLCGNGSLVVKNQLNPYVPYRWVYYRAGEFPKHAFPLVFYYKDGHLGPVLRVVPYGNGLAIDVSKTASFRVGGSSSAPKVDVPRKTLYVGEVEVDTGYPPTNVTFVRVLILSPGLARRKLLGEVVNGRSLLYLNLPFEGQFYYSKGHWFYYCTSCTPKRYYLYDWRDHALIEGNFSPDAKYVGKVPPGLWNATGVDFMFNDNRIDLFLVPLSNFSRCLPDSRPVAMKLKEMGIGNGFLLYFPRYTTGISLAGMEWAIVSDTGDDVGVMVSGKLPCPLFYYANGSIKFFMRLTLANVTIPVGSWMLTLSYPYINATPMVNVSVVSLGQIERNGTSSTTRSEQINSTVVNVTEMGQREGSSICGSGFLLLLIVSFLFSRIFIRR